MKQISINFTSSKKLLPIGCWLIKAYMNTSYSHVALEYTTSRNKSLVYEAVGVGVRFISKELWLQIAEIKESYILNMSEDQYNKVMDYCIDHAGIRYGYLQNLGIVLADLFNLKKNPFNGKEEVCSQMLGEVLLELGFVFNKSTELLTPKDIELALKMNNLFRKSGEE